MTVQEITRFMAHNTIVPVIVLGFICTIIAFYKREKQAPDYIEDVPGIVVIFMLFVPAVAWLYLSFIVVTLPLTVLGIIAYWIGTYFARVDL